MSSALYILHVIHDNHYHLVRKQYIERDDSFFYMDFKLSGEPWKFLSIVQEIITIDFTYELGLLLNDIMTTEVNDGF